MLNIEETYVCDECNGNGFTNIDTWCLTYCRKCHGFGKLNWLENLFGKRYPNHDEQEIIYNNITKNIKEGVIIVSEQVRKVWGNING